MERKKVYLVGIGMGSTGCLTKEAEQIILQSEVLIGASRMLEPFRNQKTEHAQEFFVSYRSGEIGTFLREHSGVSQASVLLSGDVGFYSGAKGLLEELKDFEVQLVPGISSMIYFSGKLKLSWEDICFTSAHGKTSNLIQRIQRNKKTFALLDGPKKLKDLCEKLVYYEMGDVVLHVGEKLSYSDEKIISAKAKNIEDFSFGNLLVVLAENEKAVNPVCTSIPDEAFIRAKVPMTKSEVRTVSIGKLQLQQDSVVYDIGAGSGSVSIEIAIQSPDIKVYAIEKNTEALELMEKNKRKFAADNMEIVSGTAPWALEKLPVPTHVFIGGSSGNMETIVDAVFRKNDKVKIVINTVALNSMAKVMELIDGREDLETDIVQMQVSKDNRIGNYHMMMGQNPIYIISICKKKIER